MAWQDRSYYRDSGQGSSNPLMWLLTGSVPLFTAFGIRVRMHVSLLVLLVISLLTAEFQGGLGWKNALTFDVTLFAIVLLHEYGHCIAGRSVGGEAKDILLWPLGGLAFVDAPNGCVVAVDRVRDASRFPMLLEVVLPPGWKSAPLYQRLAGRPLARAGAHRLEGDAGTPEPLHDGVPVVHVRSPADQPGRFDAMELPHIRAPRLLRVGRDDLEIPALSEREQGVP